MTYSVFNQTPNDATKETLFLGQPVNVSRVDKQRYEVFEKLTEKQLSFFWRPEEVDISKDRIDFTNLTEHEQHIFISNLKYQTLLDSIQGRSPTTVLLPLVSLPELENWVIAWSFFESIHSRSYTHIMRNVFANPSEVLDDIMINEHIINRATELTKYYDDLYQYSISDNPNAYELKKKLYLCLMAVNVLEGIRFYVSFACSFAFAERKLMEGNAKIIRLISRDEALHLNSTQTMLRLLPKEDEDFAKIEQECESLCINMFWQAVESEKEWINYLFKDGSMLGLNAKILTQYLEYLANIRMQAVGLTTLYSQKTNPIAWINTWLSSDTVQVSPQETEISSYLVGQIDNNLGENAFEGFEI